MSKKTSNPPPPAGSFKPPPPTEPPPVGGFARGLPVLRNHDPNDFVGAVSIVDGRHIANFKARAVPMEALAELGGGWRVMLIDIEGLTTYVRQAELLELSTVTVSPKQAREGTAMTATETVQLGDRVKDRITGFSGIVTGITTWLNGCRRVGVQPEKLDEGKLQDPQWFDEPQVDIVKRAVHVPFGQGVAITPAAPAPARRGGPRPDPTNRRE